MRTLLLAVLISGAASGQTLSNLNFEAPGTIGAVPPGWYGGSVAGSGFRYSLTNQGCLEGRQCAMLSGPPSPESDWYGILAQSVNPAPYAGRGFRMQAAVRVDGAGTSVLLWVGGAPSLNVLSPAITSNNWQYYEIENQVGNPAQLSLGFVIEGSGTAWIDDVSFTALRNDAPEGPHALSDTGLANVTAFAKVFGYVRHFHPSDQAARVSWISFAMDGIRAVEGADTAGDLAGRLQALFAPIAPTVRVFVTGNRPALAPELQPTSTDSLQLIRWNNYGVRGRDSIYHSERQSVPATGSTLPDGFEDPAQPYEAEIGRGLSVQVPLSLYQDAQGTLPHAAYAPSDCCTWSVDDRASRMAGIIAAWNEAQHFYPYFDVVQTDWPAALASALRSAATDSGTDATFRTLSLLWAALKDGHGWVWGPSPSHGVVPLVWEWVENQLVVTRVVDGQDQGIAPGDRVLALNGVAAEDAIASQQALISGATPQWILYRTLTALANCDATGGMRVDYEPYASPGASRTAQLACVSSVDWNIQPGDMVRQLDTGIMYVDLNRLTDSAWSQALPSLASASGVVFDLRGYPASFSFLPNLSQTSLDSEQWHVPVPRKPDEVDLTFTNEKWSVSPVSPYVPPKRVFLTDGRAVSAAETVMGIVENYRLAEIVGSTTAGTNGNMNYIDLPGGYTLGFTGMKVLKQDGSQHHGVGIHATIPSSRTRKGVAAGLDEVLLRGVEVLKGPQAGSTPVISSVVNAASFGAGAVAPGEMVTIFGTDLGPAQLAQTTYDSAGFLGTYAGETRAFFDDIQAPLVYASASQVSAIVPYSVVSATKVRVEYQLRGSQPVSAAVASAAPGVFANEGSNRAVMVNQDQSLNSASRPAARGEIVTLYATGEGLTAPKGITGRLPISGKWPTPVGEVAVTFGGVPGDVQFKGVISPGVLQVNVRVPASAPPGDTVAVVLRVDGVASTGSRTVALK